MGGDLPTPVLHTLLRRGVERAGGGHDEGKKDGVRQILVFLYLDLRLLLQVNAQLNLGPFDCRLALDCGRG